MTGPNAPPFASGGGKGIDLNAACRNGRERVSLQSLNQTWPRPLSETALFTRLASRCGAGQMGCKPPTAVRASRLAEPSTPAIAAFSRRLPALTCPAMRRLASLAWRVSKYRAATGSPCIEDNENVGAVMSARSADGRGRWRIAGRRHAGEGDNRCARNARTGSATCRAQRPEGRQRSGLETGPRRAWGKAADGSWPLDSWIPDAWQKIARLHAAWNPGGTLTERTSPVSEAASRRIDNTFNRKTGALRAIRTPDPQIRSLMLYPAELRARAAFAGQRGRFSRLWRGRFNPRCGARRTCQPTILAGERRAGPFDRP